MSKIYTLTVEGSHYENKITLAFPGRELRGQALGVLANASGFTLSDAREPKMESLSFATGEQDTDSVKCCSTAAGACDAAACFAPKHFAARACFCRCLATKK